MAALFPKIYDWIAQNPNKDATLRWREPIPTQGSSFETWEGFLLKPLNPPGTLSLLMAVSDPLYEMGSQALRKQMLIEQLLVLHERVDKELIGRRYPRKKIQDLLAQQISAQQPVASPILDDALSQLFEVQLVHMDRKSKRISFSPPDPRTWSTERPVFVCQSDGQWISVPVQPLDLSVWLSSKEQDGWTVAWPTADGSFEELKARLVAENRVPKGKKDELAAILGRLQALTLLAKVSLPVA
jgi:hypothetical protein